MEESNSASWVGWQELETLVHWLAVIGLASPLAISHFLDRILKAELKQKLSLYVFGAGNETVSQRVALFHALLMSALGAGFLKRSTRLLAIGVVSIIFVYSMQYFVQRDKFNDNTLPFIENIYSLRPFAIYVFISFVFVDAISFFQTTSFARLASYCRNPVEVIFLAFADIVVSLFLVIIFLPIFIFASHRIATIPHDAAVNVVLLESAQSQQITLRDLIRMAAPRVTKPDRSVLDEAETISTEGWIYSNPNLYLGPQDADINIGKAVEGKLASGGGTLLFTKGDMSPQETAASIASLLKSNADVKEVRVLDTSNDLFGNAGYLFQIEGKSEYSGLSFLTSYGFIMRDVNFFGDDFYDAISLGSKTYNENDITFTGLLSGVVQKANGTVAYICDGTPVAIVDREEFLKDRAGECKKGVAMSGWSVAGVASLLSYNLDSSVEIPVLPTALSSIFLTIAIYASIISWISLPYIRAFAEDYTEDGTKLLTDNIFTVTFCLFYVLLAPLLFYLL
ncbi:hypothetical protein HA459_18665 [Rhizobium leguminosarum bv. trifolii]|uniref:hypothetical protein n=1 Tax=Rhizobium leguminosarum TaxID=384 RepID=UPI00140FD7CA|nr:hypothetical protein [Rhizobium leguminosarum]QIO73927.1 hypothetical protein HA459_18665 [Rhizobium leguminosarum bv. trifolii]QIO80946.1 hypothetical protein HA460_18705 [Rhizobium leguminosarum bv. trifolii]